MSGVTIHPTALVDSSANLGQGPAEGPYCIVGPNVTLGENSWLQHHVTLAGPLRGGSGNNFYSYCSIGQQTQELKFRG